MPEHPLPPSIQNTLNVFRERLEATERQLRAAFGSGNVPLLTFENGMLLGDTLGLDFGTGLHASMVADGFVRVSTVDVGGGGGFDFVVDSSLTASDPVAGEFLGIGEALTAMFDAGRNHVIGLVRANATADPTLYTETASWRSPTNYMLVGVSGNPVAYGSVFGGYAEWRHNGFTSSNNVNRVYIFNMSIHNARFLGSASTQVRLDQCFINSQSLGPPTLTDGSLTALDCYFLGFPALTSNSSGSGVIYGGTIQLTSPQTGSHSPVPSAGQLKIFGAILIGQGNFSAINIPRDSQIVFNGASSVSFPIVLTAGTNSVRVYIETHSAEGVSVTVTGTTATGIIDIVGDPGKLTIASLPSCTVRIDVTNIGTSDAYDIGGPAHVDLALGRFGKVIFRGKSVKASISAESDLGNSGTTGPLLSLINCDESHIAVAANGTGAAAGTRSFTVDASSNNNIIDFAGDTTWPLAGTDAGAGNVIRVT